MMIDIKEINFALKQKNFNLSNACIANTPLVSALV